jgi:protoporphyrin/coproporphyrin ferrochelatase
MSSRRAVLLVNLGSPRSTSIRDVRSYLNEFLMDARVIDYPWILRRLIVGLFVLPFRPYKTAAAYQRVWTPEGAPLLVMSRLLQKALQEKISLPVDLGMRYGTPSIREALTKMRREQEGKIDEILLVPLYPHYAMSSYESVVVKAREEFDQMQWKVKLTVLPPFYQDPLYLKALEESIRPYLKEPYDHVLFSYHGVPERHLKKGDCTQAHCAVRENCCEVPSAIHALCYRHQSVETTRLMAQRLGMAAGTYSSSFQSRFGKEVWCEPYTDEELVRLAKSGVKRLVILCPAFVSDCLETLEEIGMEGKHLFQEHGGESYTLVPCLNTHPLFVEALAHWAEHFHRSSPSEKVTSHFA